jgi:hypothetical protein
MRSSILRQACSGVGEGLYSNRLNIDHTARRSLLLSDSVTGSSEWLRFMSSGHHVLLSDCLTEPVVQWL